VVLEMELVSHSYEKALVRELGGHVSEVQVMGLAHFHEYWERMRHLNFVVPWASVSL
jgi:hypothetical protein